MGREEEWKTMTGMAMNGISLTTDINAHVPKLSYGGLLECH